jgi:uncharacterized protein
MDGNLLFLKNEIEFIKIHQNLYFNTSTLEYSSRLQEIVPTSSNHTIEFSQLGITRLFVNVIHRCNMICEYCYASGGSYLHEATRLDVEVIVDIAKNIKSLNRNEFEVVFFGGEPLLAIDTILKCIKTFKQYNETTNFKFSIVTNGTIFNEEIRNLIFDNHMSITLSIDGTPENSNKHRMYKSNISFESILNNIPKFKEVSSELSARMVVTKSNYEIYENILFLFNLGINIISFRPVFSKMLNMRIKYSQHKQFIKEFDKTLIWYFTSVLEGNKISLATVDELLDTILFNKRKNNFCNFTQAISVTPEGEYYPCSHFVYDKKFNLGSAKNFRDVILSSNDLLNKIANIDLECGSCNIFSFCGGGCKASSHYINGNILSKDDLCRLRRSMIISIINIICTYKQNNQLDLFVKKYALNRGRKSKLYGERFA